MIRELELRRNGVVAVVWEDIGEGWDGEYDPNDDNDEPLLRFTVYRNSFVTGGSRSGGWEQVDNASYCTRMPVNADEFVLVRELHFMMELVYDRVVAGESIKDVCEKFSWVSPSTPGRVLLRDYT